MKIHDSEFKFFLVCMEDESVELLKKMNCIDLIPISIKEIEEFDKRIPELKCQRGEKTYIWTAKASVPLYLFNKYKEMDHIIWLDGDTEFLSNPDRIYEEWGENSVLLTPERFTGEYEYLGHLVGFYNTGFMGFKNDEVGNSALNYFKEKLQEWKNSEEEQASWNDQLYVDDWTERFRNVGVSNHVGINLTPFIASRINNEEHGYVSIKGRTPYIGDIPIVLYHFMAFKYYDDNLFDLCNYWMKIEKQTIETLYLAYFDKCNKAFERIRDVDPGFYPYLTIHDKYLGNYFNYNIRRMDSEYHFCTISTACQIVQTLTLYYSIKRFHPKFVFWICCKDTKSYNKLKSLNLPEVLLFQPANMIENYDKLLQSGVDVPLEVLKARFLNLILLNNYTIENILYLDNNCYFHQSPKYMFDMINANSIVLFEGISVDENSLGVSSSIIGFHRDATSLECLFYWVDKTKEWIKNGLSGKEEIDYIANWRKNYKNVFVQKNPAYLLEDKKLNKTTIRLSNGIIYANNDLLILYQYNLENISSESLSNVAEKLLRFSTNKKKHIYLQYLKSIRSSLDLMGKH